MAKSKISVPKKTARVTKRMYEELQAENAILKDRIERLIEVNKLQVDKVVGEELLQIHIRELKTKLTLLEKES